MRDDYRIGVNGLCPKCGRRLTTTYCMNCSTGVQTYDRGDGLLVSHGDYSALRNELNALRAELARVKAESLRVVVVQDEGNLYDWYMTPTGLGYPGKDRKNNNCIESAEGYYRLDECKPVRLERWEDE